jgi:hypothetical protein
MQALFDEANAHLSDASNKDKDESDNSMSDYMKEFRENVEKYKIKKMTEEMTKKQEY